MLTFSGASDDLVELEGDHPFADEFNPTEFETKHGMAFIVGWDKATPEQPVAGCVVLVRSALLGCWSVEVGMLEDGAAIPWPITIKHGERRPGEVGYSVECSIDCPNDVPVRHVADHKALR